MSWNNCAMVCGWPISSNVFLRMMTSPPVTKQPPVSASAVEAARNFKMLQFTCTGPFRRSREHFEGMIPKNKCHGTRLHVCGSVRYGALMLVRKIMCEA